jgi:hypothetical protein
MHTLQASAAIHGAKGFESIGSKRTFVGICLVKRSRIRFYGNVSERVQTHDLVDLLSERQLHASNIHKEILGRAQEHPACNQ